MCQTKHVLHQPNRRDLIRQPHLLRPRCTVSASRSEKESRRMSYYKSNAVYKMLENTPNHQFRWVSGNAWALIYGDSNSTPLVCALVYGKSWNFQAEMRILLNKIAKSSRIPFVSIMFDDTKTEINNVHFNINEDETMLISLSELRDVFESFGLPVKRGAASKAINDSSSSAYHQWQRANLGSITVSDIDLLRKSSGGAPGEIIELKRSYIPLEKWRPFPNDYANFNLLSSVADRCGVIFTIAYNLREKYPFRDDATRLSIYKYSKINAPTYLGIYGFQQFLNGDYVSKI